MSTTQVNGETNPNLKLVQICGAHGAGKNVMINHILRTFPQVVCAVPWTTRTMRNGEEPGVTYHYISEEERLRLDAAGEFINHVKIRGHHSGLQRKELMKSDRMILDITPDGARRVKKAVEGWGGRAFCVYIHAPLRQRWKRIKSRQPELSDENIEAMIVGDPVSTKLEEHNDFDLLVANKDGAFHEAFSVISDKVKHFWNR